MQEHELADGHYYLARYHGDGSVAPWPDLRPCRAVSACANPDIRVFTLWEIAKADGGLIRSHWFRPASAFTIVRELTADEMTFWAGSNARKHATLERMTQTFLQRFDVWGRSAADAETISLREVWIAAGGNADTDPTREDVLAILKSLEAACDGGEGLEPLAMRDPMAREGFYALERLLSAADEDRPETVAAWLEQRNANGTSDAELLRELHTMRYRLLLRRDRDYATENAMMGTHA